MNESKLIEKALKARGTSNGFTLACDCGAAEGEEHKDECRLALPLFVRKHVALLDQDPQPHRQRVGLTIHGFKIVNLLRQAGDEAEGARGDRIVMAAKKSGHRYSWDEVEPA